MYRSSQKKRPETKRGRPRGFDRATALRRAMEVFWKKGHEGASLSDLTTAMDINSPSLYSAFGSKDALFREAVELYRATEGAGIWESIESAPSARDGIARFLTASAETFTSPGKPSGCLVVLGALHLTENNSAVVRELKRLRMQNAETLRLRLERAVREGELSRTVDCAAVATFYLTLQEGMSIQARDGATRDALLKVAHHAMKAWDSLTAR